MRSIAIYSPICISAILLLGGCGPSAAQLDATATAEFTTQSAIQTEHAPTNTPSPSATPTQSPTATPIGGGGQITFVSNRKGGDAIFQIDMASREEIQLTFHPTGDTQPHFSTDGEKLALVSRQDGNFEIYAFYLDGKIVRLTGDASIDAQPAWSPSGDKIAFASDREGNFEIYVMNDSGTDVTRLTNSPGADWFPSWSPDGESIAFDSDLDGNHEIFVMDADGSNPKRLTDREGVDTWAKFSPDGQKIVFGSNESGVFQIYVISVDGTGLRQLTEFSSDSFHPTWSPDSETIAFASGYEGNSNIYTVGLDGGEPIALTDHITDETYPTWTNNALALLRKPWIGMPYCTRDTDGDYDPDTVTSTYTTDDFFAAIEFPFRNVGDEVSWSHTWTYQDGTSVFVGGDWDGDEAGNKVAFFSAPQAAGPGIWTIAVSLQGEVLYEISCEVVEP
ncbi:MAG: hypothetical protein ACE5M4_09365 [Anaerolineales bacterium]